VVALTAGVKAMNTKSFFSVVLVALVASHGGWALAQSGNELCEDETSGVVPMERGVGSSLLDPPRVMDCAIDDPLCEDETGSHPDRSAQLMSISDTTGAGLSSDVISNCLVEDSTPPPPPPADGDPDGNTTDRKSLDGQSYVEYALDAAGGWTGYRATLDLAAGAAGTFASLDFRGADGQLSEVRIALVTDASGARWAAATVVGQPELGVALVPVHDDRVSLALRFAAGSLGVAVDGHAASLALPSGANVEVVRVGHFAVDAAAAPVLAITAPRFLRRAH
jgi:hypothetical protein